MTAVLGAVKSLAATSCISMPERVMRDGPAKGKRVQVDVPDNNVMVLDFGNNTLGTMDTGYVMMASKAPDMELFGTEGVISTYGGDQVDRIRLYKDDWNTDVAGWQDVDIPSLDSRWAKHPSTLLSLADAVLDGKPLVNGPRHMAHVVEVIEKTWIAAESRQTVDLTTTFPIVSWKDLPIDTSTAKLV